MPQQAQHLRDDKMMLDEEIILSSIHRVTKRA
jgi:hypothetical protein